MLMYLLKSGACLAVFLMFYKLFLEKERMHFFKRYYLLGALVLSFAIPLITFVEYVTIQPVSYSVSPKPVVAQSLSSTEISENVSPIDTSIILWTVYTLGFLFSGWKFFRNLARLARRIRTNPKLRMKNITNVLLKEAVVPHTFFRYIFLNKKKFESGQIPHAVLLHEITHARQKHSLDILFIELLQMIFWFNPLLHLAKKSIKLNHEFLADQAVVTSGISSDTYQNLLLAFSSNAKTPELANALNYSSIKKRFTVMKTQTSRKSILIRTLLILPLLALLLYGFSTTIQIVKEQASVIVSQEGATKKETLVFDVLAKKYNATPKEKRSIPSGDLRTLENIYGKMTEEQKTDALPFPECTDPKSSNQEGATKNQVSEYNTLAKTYNTMLAGDGNIRLNKSDVDRLEYLHGIMTEEQRAEAEPFPDFPELPEPPLPPSPPYEIEKIEEHVEIDVREEIIKEIVEHQEIYDAIDIDQNTVKSISSNTKPPTYFSLQDDDVTIYLNGKKISYLEMMKMEEEGTITTMDISKEPNGKKIIKLNQSNPQPPAPPNPPKPKSPLELLQELEKDNVKIILDGKEIGYKEAEKLFEENTFNRVEVRKET